MKTIIFNLSILMFLFNKVKYYINIAININTSNNIIIPKKKLNYA